MSRVIFQMISILKKSTGGIDGYEKRASRICFKILIHDLCLMVLLILYGYF